MYRRRSFRGQIKSEIDGDLALLILQRQKADDSEVLVVTAGYTSRSTEVCG